jgi:hypothetical protein
MLFWAVLPHRLSRVSALASADGGGVMTLGEGGAAGSLSSDELDSTSHRLLGWVDAPMLVGLSSR